jgi:uncharacterized protein YndB with AHSA1/START domain
MVENSASGASRPELVITREFDAPRELVWAAWTEPAKFREWMGPRNFSVPDVEIDLRVGGKMHFAMRSAEGQDIWCGGVYREIVPPERIVVTDYFSDAEGNIVNPADFGMPEEWPVEALLTLTFEEAGAGRTRLTMQHHVPLELAKKLGAEQGWSETLDKLGEFLARQS